MDRRRGRRGAPTSPRSTPGSSSPPPPKLFRGLAGEYLHGIVRRGERLVDLPRRDAAALDRASASSLERGRDGGAWREWVAGQPRTCASATPRSRRGSMPDARRPERDALSAELIALGQGARAASSPSSTALKDEAKALVERWKSAAGGTAQAPQFTAEQPGRRRPHRRVDVHREGLEPHLARRLRRRGGGAQQGARARAQRSAGRVAARLGADAPGEVRRRADAIPEGADAASRRTRSRASTSATSA